MDEERSDWLIRIEERKAERNTKESTSEYKARRKRERTEEQKAKRRERDSKPENKEKERERKQEIKYTENARKREQGKRMKVYSAYSKLHSNSEIPCCRCCGETIMGFLAVDHINGRKHLPEKEKNLRSSGLINFLIKNNFPDGYQILCHNCNMAKGFYGECPHEKARKEETFAMMEEQSSFEV